MTKKIDENQINATLLAPQKDRTAIIDILRGWALLGVVIVNYSIFYNLGVDSKPHTEGNGVKFSMGVVQIFFGSKSWTLLSVLFGYGFSILISNLKIKGINSSVFFTRRMFWLFIIGIINSAFYFGDILKDYALMGLILLLFSQLNSKKLILIAIFLLAIDPLMNAWVVEHRTPSEFSSILFQLSWYKSHNIFDGLLFGIWGSFKMFFLPFIFNVRLLMLSCFLIGMSLQKINFLDRLSDNIKIIKRCFWMAWIFIIILFISVIVSQSLHLKIGRYYYIINWFTLALTFIIATGICLIYNSDKFPAIFRALQIYGRMTLTNYVMQNAIGFLLFSGCGLRLMDSMPYYMYLLAGIVIYIFQVLFSKWWLCRNSFGPLEWLWRCLSYNRKLQLRK